MALIQLPDFAIFDIQNGEGIILDAQNGRYLSLNKIATVILEVTTQVETYDEAIKILHNRIDASDDLIQKSIKNLKNQLKNYGVYYGDDV